MAEMSQRKKTGAEERMSRNQKTRKCFHNEVSMDTWKSASMQYLINSC